MIAPDESSIGASSYRSFSSQARRGPASLFVRLIAGLVAVSLGGACDTIRLTAPSGSEVRVFTNTTVVPLGGTAEIVANVIESGGTPVHDGTVVTFTTTVGTLDPPEGQTDDGQARTTLRVGNQSGTAFIRALSGGTQSDALELIVGAAAVAQVVLTSNPSSISATRGGTVTLSAVVVDEGNNPVPNVDVSFTASAGSLGSTRVRTDANGQASTSLNTNRETTVRALVGAVESNEVTITANQGPQVSVTSSPPSVAEGTPVTFNVSITSDDDTPLQNVRINFGDGETRSLGTARTSTVSKLYHNDGTYIVTVTASDVNGEESTGTTSVVVTPAPALLPNITVSPNPGRVGQPVTFTVTLTNSTLTAQIESITYNFGDGTSHVGGSPTTHIFNRVANFDVSATVTLIDGRTATANITFPVNE